MFKPHAPLTLMALLTPLLLADAARAGLDWWDIDRPSKGHAQRGDKRSGASEEELRERQARKVRLEQAAELEAIASRDKAQHGDTVRLLKVGIKEELTRTSVRALVRVDGERRVVEAESLSTALVGSTFTLALSLLCLPAGYVLAIPAAIYLYVFNRDAGGWTTDDCTITLVIALVFAPFLAAAALYHFLNQRDRDRMFNRLVRRARDAGAQTQRKPSKVKVVAYEQVTGTRVSAAQAF